jgi:hypothetical protein
MIKSDYEKRGSGMNTAGTWLIAAGVVLIAVGLLFKAGWLYWFGSLPGDIRYEGEHVRFYFPITTMILISVVLTVIMAIVRRF